MGGWDGEMDGIVEVCAGMEEVGVWNGRMDGIVED